MEVSIFIKGSKQAKRTKCFLKLFNCETFSILLIDESDQI